MMLGLSCDLVDALCGCDFGMTGRMESGFRFAKNSQDALTTLRNNRTAVYL